MLIITQTALELGFLYAPVALALFLSYRILDIAGHDHQAVLVRLAFIDGGDGIIHRLDDEFGIVGLAQTQRSLAHIIGSGRIVCDQDAVGVQLATPAENHLTMQQTMVNAQ